MTCRQCNLRVLCILCILL